MNYLITGGGGQLASELQARLGGRAVSLTHQELDITDPAAVDQALSEHQPETVINCAAFHNVDACERTPLQAWMTNVQAVRDLAGRGAKLVHLSTNYVFDGTEGRPYREDDLPRPLSAYAITKLAGEHAALAYGTGALVVRSAGLYGLHGSVSKGGNFVTRMLKRARAQGELRVVADQTLQPTFTADLADAIVEAVERDVQGVLHLTASGHCSWHEFTLAIMGLAGIEVPVHPTRTVDSPTGPRRPLNGVLARARADALGLTPLRDWRQGLLDYMSQAGLLAADRAAAGS